MIGLEVAHSAQLSMDSRWLLNGNKAASVQSESERLGGAAMLAGGRYRSAEWISANK